MGRSSGVFGGRRLRDAGHIIDYARRGHKDQTIALEEVRGVPGDDTTDLDELIFVRRLLD